MDVIHKHFHLQSGVGAQALFVKALACIWRVRTHHKDGLVYMIIKEGKYLGYILVQLKWKTRAICSALDHGLKFLL